MKEKWIKRIPTFVMKIKLFIVFISGLWLGICVMDYKEVYTENIVNCGWLRKIMVYLLYRSFSPLAIMEICMYSVLVLFIILVVLKITKEITSNEIVSH